MRHFALPLFSALMIAALFTLSGCEPQQDGAVTTSGEMTAPAATAGLNIVYIRVDSLQTGYTALADELARLEENMTLAQENLQKKGTELQNEARRFQDRVQQGLVAPNQMQSEQQRLARKEQEIMQQRDIALNSIQQDQLVLQQQFSEKIKEILEALQAEKGYDFIFNEGGGSGLLMAADAHDITSLVLERLNALDVDFSTDGEGEETEE